MDEKFRFFLSLMKKFRYISRSLDLKEENSFLKEQLRVLKNEMSSTNEGMLLLEKISLEETLNQLINEVIIIINFY